MKTALITGVFLLALTFIITDALDVDKKQNCLPDSDIRACLNSLPNNIDKACSDVCGTSLMEYYYNCVPSEAAAFRLGYDMLCGSDGDDNGNNDGGDSNGGSGGDNGGNGGNGSNSGNGGNGGDNGDNSDNCDNGGDSGSSSAATVGAAVTILSAVLVLVAEISFIASFKRTDKV